MDPTLTRVIKYVQRGSLPNKIELQQETKSVQQILRHWPRLSLVAGVLCRTRLDPKEVDPIIQLVLPKGERHYIWQLYHEQAGHWGPEKTVSLIQRRFFWPQLSKEVTDRCAQCQQCVLRKAPNSRPAALTPILTSAPLELLSVDFLAIGHPEDAYHNVKVMVDHFTKYAWAVATRDQTAANSQGIVEQSNPAIWCA